MNFVPFVLFMYHIFDTYTSAPHLSACMLECFHVYIACMHSSGLCVSAHACVHVVSSADF